MLNKRLYREHPKDVSNDSVYKYIVIYTLKQIVLLFPSNVSILRKSLNTFANLFIFMNTK